MADTIRLADLDRYVGTTLAPSKWTTIDQNIIDDFANCTGDRQFIHTDLERAQLETPFKTTIAHGMLCLSYLPTDHKTDFPIIEDLLYIINYGFNRVRFLQYVPSGSQVRLLRTIQSVTNRAPDQKLVAMHKSMEVQGFDRPAYFAEQLLLFLGDSRGVCK